MERLPPSIYGTETEYGLSVVSGSREMQIAGSNTEHINPDAFALIELIADHIPEYLDSIDEMTTNGARVYGDHGHPEYSTPEIQTDTEYEDTRSPNQIITALDELIASEMAGERIVLDIFADAIRAGHINEAELSRRLISDDGQSHGYHHNHLARSECMEPALAIRDHLPEYTWLGLHLATLSMYAGAGAIRGASFNTTTDPSFRFVTAQKATALTKTFSPHTTGNDKPLVNLRTWRPYVEKEYSRVHVTSGDTGSPWSNKIQVGTTRLIVASNEERIDDVPLPPVDPTTLYTFAGAVASDPSCKRAKLTLLDDRTINAPDVQYLQLERAQELRNRRELTTADEWVMKEWEDALGKITRDPMQLVDRATWQARYQMLLHHAEKKGYGREGDAGFEPDWSHQALRQSDRIFDHVKSGKSVAGSYRATRWSAWMPPEWLIQERMTTPPAGRPAQRGRAIAKFKGRRGIASWDGIYFFDGGPRIELRDHLGGI